MKRDNFGGPQAEPGDDLTSVFAEEHGNNEGLEADADCFEDTEWLDGWNCEVRNEDGASVVVIGHPSHESLVAYLGNMGVTINP